MVKTDPVPLTRSPAEISTLNSLRSLPDLLLYSRRPQSSDPNDRGRNVVPSSVTALRSLCSTQGRRQTVSNAAEPGSLERWLALAEISSKLGDDAQNLEREIQVHERKRIVLEGSSKAKLPPAEACELGTKLQCLQEVLGTIRFREYCRDLFVLVRNLRLRLDLYGIRMLDFERHLCRERVVSIGKLLWLLNETERCLPKLEEANRSEPTAAESSSPIEHEDYALLFEHCSDPGNPEAAIVTKDFMVLLRSLPLERTTLVRYVFEQLADGRRGEGYRPPPDYTRIHHLHAAIKLQRSHCSTAEIQAAEAWLQVVGTKAVTLQDLLQFHLTVSDANVTEDAEFVRFLQRMWGFDPFAVKDADRGEAIQHLVENYTARCNLLEVITRKRELLTKIPSAQARIRSVTTLLEFELQHIRSLQAPAGLSHWLQCDESVNSRLGGTLVLLRELTLSGQSLPKELVHLPFLEVLNAAENELTEIPLEWHAFQTQNDGTRVLHLLMLRRNPLSNKILMGIVDGSTDGSLFATRAWLNGTSDDSACEGVIKKLLDGLRDASVILRPDRAPTRKAWIDSDEDDEGPSNKPKWRGVARDVNNYLEQRLRAMQRPNAPRGSASLRVDLKSFERLVRTLPFTCSKRELAHVVRRFLVLRDADDEGQAKRNRQIDGLAFLQAIERFGRWRSISTPSKRPMSSVVKPTVDSAGPIIQYLVVLHRRMQQEQREEQEGRARSPRPKLRFKIKPRKQKEPTKTSRQKDPSTAKRKPPLTMNQVPEQLIKPCKTRADVIADRQRQRIQVLEQQLVDQKLLLLAHQKPNLGRSKSSDDNNGSAIAPADLATVSDNERSERQAFKTKLDGAGTVTISVKCLHLRGAEESEKIGDQQMHPMKKSACLDFRLEPDDSVFHLKHQIESRTGVPIDHQILVTNSVNRGAPAIRLRNSATLREYSEHVGGVSRWSLTLLIGQSLPLFSGHSAT
ncbi:hypothetical protein PC111_g2923 [Phytophthora cactorum]|nr:hypothetical protein PC111_g2923 [Phytophthora cactorum]KAG3032209.1 hypothetical protein PC120_g2598 [Phytophthora cactorum]